MKASEIFALRNEHLGPSGGMTTFTFVHFIHLTSLFDEFFASEIARNTAASRKQTLDEFRKDHEDFVLKGAVVLENLDIVQNAEKLTVYDFYPPDTTSDGLLLSGFVNGYLEGKEPKK